MYKGKYWKTLPREEREIWEAKALVAQAEHRKRYPDWRFRPGANALAKLKVKDGPGTANRRRNNATAKKNRGDAESKKKNKSKDERCSMIADLLVEGKTGAELESALRNWENEIGSGVGAGKGTVNQEGQDHFGGRDDGKWGEATAGDRAQMESVQRAENLYHPSHSTEVNIDGHDHPQSQPRCKTPPDDRFKVPLTAMFKRSLSTPAMHFASSVDAPCHRSHNSIASNFSDVTSDTASSPSSLCSPSTFPAEQYEDSIAAYNDSMGHPSPLVLPSGIGDGSPAHWNDVSSANQTFCGLC